MKTLAIAAIVLAVICFVLGVISRVTMNPLPIMPGGLEARALLAFTNTCLLMAAVMLLLQLTKK